jgi:hypothetical protein
MQETEMRKYPFLENVTEEILPLLGNTAGWSHLNQIVSQIK